MIDTVVGMLEPTFSGDNGPASQAGLNAPYGIVRDGNGDLYIADTGNHRVRRVDGKTAIITTVAGIGRPGFSGDGDLAREPP